MNYNFDGDCYDSDLYDTRKEAIDVGIKEAKKGEYMGKDVDFDSYRKGDKFQDGSFLKKNTFLIMRKSILFI